MTIDAPNQSHDPSSDSHSEEFTANAIKNMFNLFFNPELEKRVREGRLLPGFQLVVAQALLRDDQPAVVRFNEEARLRAVVKAPRAAVPGDFIDVNDLGIVQSLELLDDELDCGHVTVIRTALTTQLTFNFRRGRSRAAEFTDQAEDFLDTAVAAITRGKPKVAIENLHTAAEKVCLCNLIIHMRPEAHGSTHKVIRSGINIWRKTGNIDPAFVSMFNKLSELRDKVRYSSASETPPIPVDAPELIRAEIDILRQHWRWRDGHVELLLKRRPDIVMAQLDNDTGAIIRMST